MRRNDLERPKMEWCGETGKPCYDKKAAQTARNSRDKTKKSIRIYPCPNCNAWHLAAKKDENGRRRIRRR